MAYRSRRWSEFVAVIALLLLAIGAGPAFAQDVPPGGADAKTSSAFATVQAHIVETLGIETAQLKPETDLIRDLKLDRSLVYYVLEDLYEAIGVMAPEKELTRLGEIAAYVESAPPAIKISRKGLPAKSPGTAKTYVQTVYFATNRKATGKRDPADAFSGQRAKGGQVRYGKVEVNIPASHKRGQLESPLLHIKALRDSKKHIYVLKLDGLDAAGFFSQVAASGSGRDDIIVYIHGFNVTFDAALRRAAQIAFDFQFKGTPIVFTWPSDGSLKSYNADWEDVLWSVKHIERFLSQLSEELPGRKIHLIAHSMGNKGLLYALRLLAYRKASAAMFGSVILCAPDFDADLFISQIAEEIRPFADQWIVYSSKNDFALILSEQINAAPRLGTPVAIAEGFQIIDASEIEVTPWSVPETHSYYATKKRVLDDMVSALKGLRPEQRGLRAFTSDAGQFWVLR